MPMRTLRFFKNGHFSPLIRVMKHAILAMYGDEAALATAHHELADMANAPIPDAMRVIQQVIRARLDGHESSDRVHAELFRDPAHYHVEGVPFTDFERDPAPISQIKKIVNALYHAEKALLVVEAMDVDHLTELTTSNSVVPTLSSVPMSETVHHVYELCRLLTHPDVDLALAFGQEWVALKPMFNQLRSHVLAYSTDARAYLAEHHVELAHQAGVLSGIGVNQLNPHQGGTDYEFITQLSAELPGYLDQITGVIQQFSSEVAEREPTIDRREINAREGDALTLLHLLEDLNPHGILLPLNTLNYIHIARHIYTLSMSILNEIGHLNDASQDFIRGKLTELKYNQLAKFMAFTDKVEEEMLLRPGQLSGLLMTKIEPLYAQLMSVATEVVDFSTEGHDLLTLEDTGFFESRLEPSYVRQAKRDSAQVMLGDVKRAHEAFFAALEAHGGRRLSELDGETKQRLIGLYRVIQPHVAAIDLRLSNAMVRALFIDEFEPLSWAESLLGTDVAHVFAENDLEDVNGDYIDSIDSLLVLRPQSIRSQLNEYFDKADNTHRFHRQLNDDFIKNAYDSVDELTLSPYNPRDNAFVVDESPVLGEGHLLIGRAREALLHRLTSEQALILHQLYSVKLDRVVRGRQAHHDFLAALARAPSETPLHQLQPRNRLCNLYGVFQPLIVSALAEDVSFLSFDQAMIDALSGQNQGAASMTVGDFRAGDRRVQARYALAEQTLREKIETIQVVALQKKQAEQLLQPLIQDIDAAPRATFLVRVPQYAAHLAHLRGTFRDFMQINNAGLREALISAEPTFLDGLYGAGHLESGSIPFPELEQPTALLRQPEQVLSFKRWANCLFHLEEASIQLELLDNQSAELWYVTRVFEIQRHGLEAMVLLHQLMADPYLSALAGELMASLQQTSAMLNVMGRPYYPLAPDRGVDTPAHDAIFYVANTLMILPEQIAAIQAGMALSPRVAQETHDYAESVSTDIRRMIANAGLSFKLLLETPTMYRLFTQLTEKWNTFSATTHDVTMQHLASINHDAFTSILLEVDQWEDKLSLKPGLLTLPMKQILDAYYQGLLEPLGLRSRHLVALVTNMEPFNKRLQATNERIAAAESSLADIVQKQGTADAVIGGLGAWDTRNRHDWAVSFNALRPLLTEAIPSCNTAYRTVCDDVTREELLHADAFNQDQMTPRERGLIIGLAGVYKAYLDGLAGTQQLALNTAREKKTHLEEQMLVQINSNHVFVNHYIKKTLTFDRQLLAYSGIYRGLVHCDKAYNQALLAYVQRVEPDIIARSAHADDIDEQVKVVLAEKIAAFEAEHLHDYRQLEGVHLVISQLRDYLHSQNEGLKPHGQTWVFESHETLTAKRKLVGSLELILTKDGLSAHERMKQLHLEIKRPRFKDTLLAYHHYETFTFTWLVQCFVSLCELIGLYKPERKVVYEGLVASVGFFSESRKREDNVLLLSRNSPGTSS